MEKKSVTTVKFRFDPAAAPGRVKIAKVTDVEHFDGRGKRWGDTEHSYDVIGDMSLTELGRLIAEGADYLAYAATHPEEA